MGMAPTPEQFQKQRELSRGGEAKGPKPMVEGDIPPLHPLFKSKISNLIYGMSWTYQKKILDHVEILCNTDRTWEIVRRVVMGLMNEQVEILQKVIGQEVRELQIKSKETTDGNGEGNGSAGNGTGGGPGQ